MVTKTLATLTIIMSLAVPTAKAGDLLLVVDGSTAMWRELADGTTALVAVRNALSDVAAAAPASLDLRFGMRWIGSQVPRFDDRACTDTTLAVPVAPADPTTIAAAFDDVLPTGSRPLVLGIVEAASDFPEPATSRRIVLVISGDDDCDGDRSRAAQVLGAGVELRIVGVQLDDLLFERFSAVAPSRNATTSGQLASALRWAVFDIEDLATVRVPTTVRTTRAGSLANLVTVRLVNQATDAVVELEPAAGSHHGTVPPGRYTAAVIDEHGHETEFGPLTVVAGGEAFYDLPLDAGPSVTLESTPQRPTAGDEVWVHHWGAPPGQHWVAVAPAGAPLHDWTARTPTSHPSGEVAVRLPVEPQPLEVRFMERLQGGATRVTGRAELVTSGALAGLELPAIASIGDLLSVEWRGPDQPGDHVSITADGADPAAHTACVFASSGNPARLPAPPVEGRYVVRYISGLTGRELAVGALEVVDESVTLSTPDRVTAGARFTVSWGRPVRTGDYLLVAAPESGDDDYLSLHPTSGGDQLSVTAPATPGRYELRYVDGSDDEVMARAMLEVVAIRIELRPPATVTAGTRFDVDWQGPAAPGDIIALAPMASGWRRRLDWVYATPGKPADLAAPFEPGRYEIRYVSTSQRAILARAPVTVE